MFVRPHFQQTAGTLDKTSIDNTKGSTLNSKQHQ